MTRLHSINAITLDLDDTLWAIGPVIARAERVLWEWFGEQYPRITDHWDSDKLQELRAAVIQEHKHRVHDLRFLREEVLRRMADAVGYDRSLAASAFAVFDEQRNTVELFPDAMPGLERLAEKYRLIALTNGNACLDRIGIRHLFDDVVTATETGVAKPDARIFAAACERAGLAAENVLHVGDHPELDVEGARLAGMRTAWVNRIDAEWPDALPQPDAEVSTLHELADRLLLQGPG